MNRRTSEDRQLPSWEVGRKTETAAGETVTQGWKRLEGQKLRVPSRPHPPKSQSRRRARRKPGLATRLEWVGMGPASSQAAGPEAELEAWQRAASVVLRGVAV